MRMEEQSGKTKEYRNVRKRKGKIRRTASGQRYK